MLAQLGIELLVDRELTGVDDRHVEARADRVIQEHRVHRLADPRRAAERERQVRDAARDLDPGARVLDLLDRLDEADGVRVVLLDPGADREDVGIEDDVLGGEPDLLGQDLVGALGDLHAVLDRGRLAGLVERHDDDRGAEPPDDLGLTDERFLAFLERDRVDDALALQALEAGLEHAPLRRVDHHRDPRDVGFGRDQVEEPPHRDGAVDHALVHAHVEDVGAALDLLARDRHGLVVLVFLDQPAELRRAGDVGALADHHEVGLRRDGQRLEATEAHVMWRRRELARRHALDRGTDRRDVLGARAAATADQVEQALACEVTEDLRHVLGRVVVAAELVGKTGVGIAGGTHARDPRELCDVRAHVLGAERAVDRHREQVRVRDRVEERLDRLTAERAAGPVGDRHRDDHRDAAHALGEQLLERVQRGLAVEGVDVGLGNQKIHPALDQCAGLLRERIDQLAERDRACPGIVDVRRERGGLRGRADRTTDPAWPAVLFLGTFRGVAGTPRRREVEIADHALEAVVGEGERGGGERVGLDDVGASSKELQVDLFDRIRTREDEQVVTALERAVVIAEPRATPHGLVCKSQRLHHGPHRTVEHDDPAREGFAKLVDG